MAGSRIKYRVVDEYEGETLSDDTERSSDQPLTLGELETFFLGAWSFMDVLQSNFENDVNGMLGFFQAKSQFYPELDNLLRLVHLGGPRSRCSGHTPHPVQQYPRCPAVVLIVIEDTLSHRSIPSSDPAIKPLD
jgi:hypothetical protein